MTDKVQPTVFNRPLVVRKYGGKSLANPELILRIAQNIIQKKQKGFDLVVVVSAMGQTTDDFIAMAHKISPNPTPRELDMLMSVGERISISLLAMAINASERYQAISFTGSQIGLITDCNHTEAKVLQVKALRIKEALEAGKIVIVAGFQGVSTEKEITTLGRGGSDTTAVALAAALNADCCEIMSDVDGLYTADPKKIKTAKRIDKIHYDQALEMAAAGAKMLHHVSVDIAKRHQVALCLGSSFSDKIGTIVTDESMNKGTVSAVTCDQDLVIFDFDINIARSKNLGIDICNLGYPVKLWQSIENRALLGIAKNHFYEVKSIIQQYATNIEIKENKSIISIIGIGIGMGSRTSKRFLMVLNHLDIIQDVFLSSELFLKALIPTSMADRACQKLHKIFIDKNPNIFEH